jgi:MoaA/NifB/PqqE/SkfB family radical SAM enzyme
MRLDPIYVRASVYSKCNLDCIYCPKQGGMENKVPARLRGQVLTRSEYCDNLRHIARNGVRGISFTGGEATFNPHLPYLAAFASEYFENVELTSNGFRIVELLPELSKSLSLLKISLDATSPQIVADITRGTRKEASRAISAIRAGCKSGIAVGVNVVAMRRTLPEIANLVDLCRQINNEGYEGSCYLSILDFYYTAEARDVWEKEFVPMNELESLFISRYGQPTAEPRFGCRFLSFDVDGVRVRLKDSSCITLRAPKCGLCRSYCQEGVYGLKHSIEGWVTTCPSNEEDLGAFLRPGLSDRDADEVLSPVLADISEATPDPTSFQKLLAAHTLAPLIASRQSYAR